MDKIKLELLTKIEKIRRNLKFLNKKNIIKYINENGVDDEITIYVTKILPIAQVLFTTINHIQNVLLSTRYEITDKQILQFSDEISLALETSNTIFNEIRKIVMEKDSKFNILSPKRKSRKVRRSKIRKSRKVRKSKI